MAQRLFIRFTVRHLLALAMVASLSGVRSASATPIETSIDTAAPWYVDPSPDPSASAPAVDAPFEAAEPASPTRRYIVVLADPPVAQYRGGIAGLAPTAVDAVAANAAAPQRDVHLDAGSKAAQAYARYLDRVQTRYLSRIRAIAPEAHKTDWRFKLALNGFAVELSPANALRVMQMDGVRLVYPEEQLEPELDSTATLLGTVAAWEQAGGTSEAGLGARLAIIDTGADAQHPMFNDTGMPPAPDGFPVATLHGRDGTVLEYPDKALLTNNKVIATRVFYQDVTTDTLAAVTPWAHNNGDHGLHVAGIAGGRYGTYDVGAFGQNLKITMGGVAPNAHILFYGNYGSTVEFVAVYDQMLLDKVDAVNISQGHAGWLIDGPRHHPVALAQSAAAEAGLVTVASSGNAGGNGRASLSGAWKYSDDILVVGNTTTTGSFEIGAEAQGDELPAELANLVLTPVSSPLPPADVQGELYFVPTGNGCNADTGAKDKIAVVVYFNDNGTVAGGCALAARVTAMQQSGAMGLIIVSRNAYLGVPGPVANLAIPVWSIGRRGGVDLQDWLTQNNTVSVKVKAGLVRGASDLPDVLAGSSSRGPGLDWGVKPDISAPGTNVLSSRVSAAIQNNQVVITRFFGGLSGTSMSSPHVAGAAALIRSVHPNWTVPQVMSAIINTSSPTVVTGDLASPVPASTTDGGPGRLDMRHALDPGVFLTPQKLSYGVVPEGVADDLEIALESASDKFETWKLTVEPGGGDAVPELDLTEITLAPGAHNSFVLTLDTEGLDETEHWGHVVLARQGTDQVVRVPYFALVQREADMRDVLLVNWTYGDTQNYASHYTKAFEDLGLTYSVWNMGDTNDGLENRQTTHPTFAEMYRHRMVILNANMSPMSLQLYLAGQFQYQNYMLAGGNFLIAGQGTQGFWRFLGTTRYNQASQPQLPDTWPRAWNGPAQNLGCEMCLARYFAGYTPVLTATLSGKLLVPFPMRPEEPEMEVVLRPHPDAAPGPFAYPLDISTGAKAPEGAEGNQYRFNSGKVVDGYYPSTSAQITVGLGDIDMAESVLDRIVPLARPLWSYPVKTEDGEDDLNAVGTYVAGRQTPAADVAWNAMYWGFGLEGVGEGAEGTVSQARLMGDTFNFMVNNLWATARSVGIVPDSDSVAIRVDVAKTAEEVRVKGVEIDWGDGMPAETQSYAPKVLPETETFGHKYAKSGDYRIVIKYLPADGEHMAPVYATTTVTVKVKPKGIFLPLVMNTFELNPGPPAETPMPAPAVLPARRDD